MGASGSFDILPAIDLRGGRVVRLEQGDFGRETSFDDDPVAVAERFVGGGATWLHVVDLDGARDGRPAHAAELRDITASVGERTKVELAGGLRDIRTVDAALGLGAARVVLGTLALEDPGMVGRLVDAYGSDRIAVAVDVRAGQAVGRGWAGTPTGVDASAVIARLAEVGVTVFEVTAIERDGLLAGPDLALYERAVRLDRGAIIASAGTATVEHLRAVRDIGCRGAIVGRALYEGTLRLEDALATSR